LTRRYLEIPGETVQRVALEYTRESGVRNLERELSNIARKVARDLAEGKRSKQVITAERLEDFLGPPRFQNEVAMRTATAGVATGLAWTQSGGDILFIEATYYPGKGMLKLTGQLGEVMVESAQAAYSYLLSNQKDLGLPSTFAKRNDIHVHIPAGAVPKDGPSAGVTMATALYSLLTDRPVRSDLAMTGEITLRGQVLPVGGLKEKVLAAKLAGIEHVLVPDRNRKDIEDIPEGIREGMVFHYAKTIDDVLKQAVNRRAARPAKKARPSKVKTPNAKAQRKSRSTAKSVRPKKKTTTRRR
jgi:ATP-dependent Lon protease